MKYVMLKSTIKLLIILFSCGTIIVSCTSNEQNYIIYENADDINKAFEERDFEQALLECNEIYEDVMENGSTHKKIWLAFCYYMVCCYSIEEDTVRRYVELYTSKFVYTDNFGDLGDLSSVVKIENQKWYTSMFCCEKLIKSAYNSNPSYTNEEISSQDYQILGFSDFAKLVINHGI